MVEKNERALVSPARNHNAQRRCVTRHPDFQVYDPVVQQLFQYHRINTIELINFAAALIIAISVHAFAGIITFVLGVWLVGSWHLKAP